MKKPVTLYYTTSVLLKVCRSNHVVGKADIPPPPPPQIQLPTPTTLVGPPLLSRLKANNYNDGSNKNPIPNPCLRLFFDIKPPAYWRGTPQFSDDYLQQLLPQAWSHSPLTTLKLIFNLRHRRGKFDDQAFYTAAYWLYQYHPKTLACNVVAIAASFGTFLDLLKILYRTLQGKDQLPSARFYLPITKGIEGRTWTRRRREKILAMAKKALERITSDDEPECLEITRAADFFPHIDSSYDRATLLCESIAKKVFPPGGGVESEEADNDYAYSVRKRLWKEVLVPLKKALATPAYTGGNKWGYDPGFKREPCAVETYLEDVVKAGKSKIKAGALLPNEIIGYLKRRMDNDDDDDVHDLMAAAGLQWKTMVDDFYLKQGKFKKCLVVCDVESNNKVSVGLGLLLSQLSEEPWNGKVITYNENPRLVSIQGHDLKSKYEFMTTKLGPLDVGVNFEKVFDLILKVAVDENLKPEQMIERVYVFTPSSGAYNRWETSDFEAMQRKFKEKGYGDVVPHIVYWNIRAHMSVLEMPNTQPGLGFTKLSGFVNNNLVKFFLDNGGDFGPEHAMGAAISGQDYQNLVIVD
ncbi:uncharacterized protein LOC110754069 [Prunus avium]|uniref:Uncharacterized protein LOC110754069 n=1 Tax=Prunus avium TaxID=42229 RepID=A0A6P5S516_PRUAV|nr:uncharacterized protein LOC110754069 [Prunus avium]